MPSQVDYYERVSRYITILLFGLALLVYIIAPVIALSWRQQPFPGFLVEHTLVVNNREGRGWAGRQQGLAAPQVVTRFGSEPISTIWDYHAAVIHAAGSESVSVFIRLPNGELQLYPSVPLSNFQARDFVAMFWLPYIIGLAYLLIAAWVYWASGSIRPGRALTFFCLCVSLSTGLLFDALTTHFATPVWIAAMSLLGGSVVSLAVRFPVESRAVSHHPWILGLPYLPSIAMAIWVVTTLTQFTDPWQYLTVRGLIYRYTAAACLFFLAVMYYRARASSASGVRRQARVVLLGSALSFLPIIIWFLAPVFGRELTFNSALLLPGLIRPGY